MLSAPTDTQINLKHEISSEPANGNGGNSGKRLIAIFCKQYERRTLLLLTRAFRQWSREFPLQNQCDELGRQLRERNAMLETVRGSYLKDVVSIKYHLNQLTGLNPHLQVEKFKEALFDLHHHLPSVDLREIIDRARRGWAESSQLLRDTLVDAGIVDPETEKTLNAWEQSRAFWRMQRVKRGPSYTFPPAGGESIYLAAPTNYKLFVRYCRECTGIVALVKNWNAEVEASLKFKVENDRVHEKLEEFKKLIRSLQDIIENKEKEILHLHGQNTELEKANQWFKHWVDSQQTEALRFEAEELQRRLLENARMALADKESFVLRLKDQQRREREEDLQRERVLQQLLEKEKAERARESEVRVKLSDDLREMQRAHRSLASDYEQLRVVREEELAEKTKLEHKLKELDREHVALRGLLDLKEAQFEDYRHTTSQRLEEMHHQVHELHKEVHAKENENDRLRDEVRQKKLFIAKQAAEVSKLRETIDSLESRVSELESQVRELEETIANIQSGPKKRKLTLRIVAIAVRSLFRLALRAKRQELKELGLFGHQILLRNKEHQNFRLQGDVQHLQQRLQELMEMILKYETERESLYHTISELKQAGAQRDKELDALRDLMSQQQRELMSLTKQLNDRPPVVLNDQSEWLLQKALVRVLRRVKAFTKMQRSIAHELGRLLWRMRGAVQAWNLDWNVSEIEKEMHLMDKLFDASHSGKSNKTPNNNKSSTYAASSSGAAAISTLTAATGLFDNNTFSTQSAVLPRAPRTGALWQSLRDFVQLDLLAWLRGQRSIHNFPVPLGYDAWERWISLRNVDPWTGEDKKNSDTYTNDELQLRLSVRHFHEEERRKIAYLDVFLKRDVANIEEFMGTARECINDWRAKLARCAEVDQAYRQLVDKYAELSLQYQQLQMNQPTDRTVISRPSEKTSVSTRMRLMQTRQSFRGLMDTDMSSYLSRVLGAISSAQEEHASSLNTSRSSTAGGESPARSGISHKSAKHVMLNSSNSNTPTPTNESDISEIEKDPGFQAAVRAFSRPGSTRSSKSMPALMRRLSAMQYLQNSPLNEISERSIEEQHSLEGLSEKSLSLQRIETLVPPISSSDPIDEELSPSRKMDKSVSFQLRNILSKSRSKSSVEAGADELMLSTNDNGEDMDEVPVDLDEDEVEDLMLHGELDVMRTELESFMKHEQNLKAQIFEGDKQIAALQDEISRLQQENEEIRAEFVNHYQDRFALRRELTKLLNEFEKLCRENSLLREMVQDGYRYFSGEKDDILNAMDFFLREQERKRIEAQQAMLSKETQVDCVPCEMLFYSKLLKSVPAGHSSRVELSSPSPPRASSPSHRHGNHHAHRFPSASAYHEHQAQQRRGEDDFASDPHNLYDDAVVLVPRQYKAFDLSPTRRDPPPPQHTVDPSVKNMSLRLKSFRDDYDEFIAEQRKRNKTAKKKGNEQSVESFVEHVLNNMPTIDDSAVFSRSSGLSEKSMDEKKETSGKTKKSSSSQRVVTIPHQKNSLSRPKSALANSVSNMSLELASNLQIAKLEEPSLALSTQRTVVNKTEPSLSFGHEGEAVYRNKQFFNYATTTLLRPQTASSMPTKTSSANNDLSASQNRPKSGVMHTRSAKNLSLNRSDEGTSKFRQIRQIPNSASAAAVSEKNTTYDVGYTLNGGLSQKPRPLSSSALVRKLYSGKKTTTYSPAEHAASEKKAERTVSNTAAFIQQNVLSKKMMDKKQNHPMDFFENDNGGDEEENLMVFDTY